MVSVGDERILAGCVYRPEKEKNQDDAILKAFLSASSLRELNTCDVILIAGDFNMPKLNWSTSNSAFLCGESFESRFLETIDDCFLTQCVSETTFIRGPNDTVGSFLDLILTDSESRMLEMRTLPPLGTIQKAHVVLNWKFSVGKFEKEIFRPKRCWRRGDYISFGLELSKINWVEKFGFGDLDQAYDFFLFSN